MSFLSCKYPIYAVLFRQALDRTLLFKLICLFLFQVMDVGLLKQHLAKQHQQTGAATSHKEVVKGEGHLCPDCGKKCQYLSELEIHMAIQVNITFNCRVKSTNTRLVLCNFNI